MANTIRYIDDGSGNHVFPVTHERAVLDDDGRNIGEKIKEFPLDFGTVSEDGIYFVDEALNIGAKIDDSGITAINSLEIEEI